MDDLNMRDLATQGAAAASAGLLGRLIALSRQRGRRLGWNLLWELPVALGLGLLGVAISSHFHLGGWESYGVSIVTAYVGPPAIDELIRRGMRCGGGSLPPS